MFAFGITFVFPSSPHLVLAPRPVVTQIEAEEALILSKETPSDTRDKQNLVEEDEL